MKKRIISAMLAVTMIAGLITGCGGNSSDKGRAGEDGKVKLTLWHMEETDARVQAFQEVIDKFNESQSEVEVSVAVQSWDDAYTKVPSAIQAGNGPDILQAIPDFCSVIYDMGVVQDLSDVISDLDEKYSFLQSSLTPYTYEDGIYAVPAFGMAQVLWYRKDMFDAAGLSAPTTFEELLECAKALTDKENSKYGIALLASLSMATDQVLYSLIASAGGKDVVNGENKVTFNNEGTVAALKLYQELLQYAPSDCDTYAWGEPQALLNQGTIAMAIEKGQYLSTFESESGVGAENLCCVPIPVLNESCTSTSIYYSNGFMLLSDDEAKREAAKAFFDFMLSEEAYGELLNAEPGLFLPVTETGGEYSSWLSNEVLQKYPEEVEGLLASAETGELFGFTDGICRKIGSITGPNLIAQTLQQITVNGKTAEEAAQWGQSAMEEAVSK